jgi:hypothetical protein
MPVRKRFCAAYRLAICLIKKHQGPTCRRKWNLLPTDPPSDSHSGSVEKGRQRRSLPSPERLHAGRSPLGLAYLLFRMLSARPSGCGLAGGAPSARLRACFLNPSKSFHMAPGYPYADHQAKHSNEFKSPLHSSVFWFFENFHLGWLRHKT